MVEFGLRPEHTFEHPPAPRRASGQAELGSEIELLLQSRVSGDILAEQSQDKETKATEWRHLHYLVHKQMGYVKSLFREKLSWKLSRNRQQSSAKMSFRTLCLLGNIKNTFFFASIAFFMMTKYIEYAPLKSST